MSKFLKVTPILLGLILAGCGGNLTSQQVADICHNRLDQANLNATQEPLPFNPKGIDDIKNVSFSPDGGQVAFDGKPSNSSEHYLYVADSKVQNLKPIASNDGPFLKIVWSSDGRFVSYSRTGAQFVYVKIPKPDANEMYIKKDCSK